jgi:hypothetical protein
VIIDVVVAMLCVFMKLTLCIISFVNYAREDYPKAVYFLLLALMFHTYQVTI